MIHYFSGKKYNSKIRSLPDREKEPFSKLPETENEAFSELPGLETKKPRWQFKFKKRFRLFEFFEKREEQAVQESNVENQSSWLQYLIFSKYINWVITQFQKVLSEKPIKISSEKIQNNTQEITAFSLGFKFPNSIPWNNLGTSFFELGWRFANATVKFVFPGIDDLPRVIDPSRSPCPEAVEFLQSMTIRLRPKAKPGTKKMDQRLVDLFERTRRKGSLRVDNVAVVARRDDIVGVYIWFWKWVNGVTFVYVGEASRQSFVSRLTQQFAGHGNYLDLNDPASPFYFETLPEANPILRWVSTNDPADFNPGVVTERFRLMWQGLISLGEARPYATGPLGGGIERLLSRSAEFTEHFDNVRVYLLVANRSQLEALAGGPGGVEQAVKSAESKVIQILVEEARVGFDSTAPRIVDFTNGWCSGPVVCVNSQMPPRVYPCDMELLGHLVMAPLAVIDRLKGNLSPTEIQRNSLRANRESVTYIDQLFVV